MTKRIYTIKTTPFILAAIVTGALSFQNCGQINNEASFSSIPEETPIGIMEVIPDQIELTPSGCTDSTHPVCNGSLDFVRKQWGSSGRNSTTGVYVGATSDNGAINTNRLRALDSRSDAAAYCADMVYNGFDDWYLPSRVELEAMFQNRNKFGMVNKDFYWSSSENSTATAYAQSMTAILDSNAIFSSDDFYKETQFYVRCIRKKTN